MSQARFNEWEAVATLYEKQEDRFDRVKKRNFQTLLEHAEVDGDDLLDMACGNGEFVAFAANRGYTVTGVDKSSEMLSLAEQRTDAADVDVTFQRADMRELTFSGEFDIVTCWYNSLNYLCEPQGLREAIESAYRSLRPGGVFLFDFLNGRRLKQFAESPAVVPHDTDELFETHHDITYESDTDVLSVSITGFVNEGDSWTRVDETHKNRGYSVDHVTEVLEAVGFSRVRCWDDVETQAEPGPHSERIWTIAEK